MDFTVSKKALIDTLSWILEGYSSESKDLIILAVDSCTLTIRAPEHPMDITEVLDVEVNGTGCAEVSAGVLVGLLRIAGTYKPDCIRLRAEEGVIRVQETTRIESPNIAMRSDCSPLKV